MDGVFGFFMVWLGGDCFGLCGFFFFIYVVVLLKVVCGG